MLEYVMFWGQENYQSKSNKLVQLAKKKRGPEGNFYGPIINRFS